MVIILPREAQVVGEVAQIGRVFVGQAVPKRFGFPRPQCLVVRWPGNFPWRVQMVAVDVEGVC